MQRPLAEDPNPDRNRGVFIREAPAVVLSAWCLLLGAGIGIGVRYVEGTARACSCVEASVVAGELVEVRLLDGAGDPQLQVWGEQLEIEVVDAGMADARFTSVARPSMVEEFSLLAEAE